MSSQNRSPALADCGTNGVVYSEFLDTVWTDARISRGETCYLADVKYVFESHNFSAVDRCVVLVLTGHDRFRRESRISPSGPATLVMFPSGNGRAYVEYGIFSLPEKAVSYASGGAGALLLLVSDDTVTAHEIRVSKASAATSEVRHHIEVRRGLARNGSCFGPRFSGSLARACATFARIDVDDDTKARNFAWWTEEIPF